MKKSILLFAVALGMLTACDPVKDDKDFILHNISTQDLSRSISFTQADADGNTAADGNYFTYNTNPAMIVTIYTLRADGSENILSYGKTGGTFSLFPSRGSDPNQTIYTRVVNSDGSETVVENIFNVFVQTELNPEIKYLASNNGSKKWKWDTSIKASEGKFEAWGNMAYACEDGEAFANKPSSQWWGCAPEYLWSEDPDTGQYGHTDKDKSMAGEGDSNAYMIFTEDGRIQTCDANGNVLRSSTYAVEGYDGTRHMINESTPWSLGTLKTATPAIMFPYQINGKGTTVTEFEILKLDDDQLVLVYPGKSSAGTWEEATFWRFIADANADLINKSWTWDTSIKESDGKFEAWGNMAYACEEGSAFANNPSSQWWGCAPEYLWSDDPDTGQLKHTDGDMTMAGEGDSNAYMTFTTDGLVTSYDANGKVLREGAYQLELFDQPKEVGGKPWNIGTLKTSTPAILFPYMINGSGTTVTEFEVMKLSGTQLVLVYPGKSTAGSWEEATFWRFKKK